VLALASVCSGLLVFEEKSWDHGNDGMGAGSLSGLIEGGDQ